jgi:hypothetical protein
MSKAFSGGCLCGAVRYESSTPPQFGGHCHCVDCRKSSGSGHCSHLILPAATVNMTGKLTGYDKPADSGNMVTRYFCPTCGAPVYSTNSATPDLIYLRASSLDDPEVFTAGMIVYASRAPSWDVMDESLPAFPEMPPNAPTQGG